MNGLETVHPMVKGGVAARLVAVGDYKPAGELAAEELAAWMSVTRVLLNLHETITRY